MPVMIYRFKIFFYLLIVFAFISSCKKNSPSDPGAVVPPDFKLSYGDSVFFLKNQAADYIISPVQMVAGTYGGFPEGIEIDTKTGAINVSKCETGLRYRISFKPDGATDSFTTVLLISGINFLDGFYKLTTKDSILNPVYNAKNTNPVPGTGNGSIFDEGANCNGAGCKVDVSNGTINLAETVRNGVFGTTPANNDRHEFQMNYRINDKSGKALNTLKVKLYYFDSINDVTQEAYDIIASRDGAVFRSNSTAGLTVVNAKPFGSVKASKPRPPCIFILAR
jgi:hypothetical protein